MPTKEVSRSSSGRTRTSPDAMVEPYEMPCPSLPRFAMRTCPFLRSASKIVPLGGSLWTVLSGATSSKRFSSLCMTLFSVTRALLDRREEQVPIPPPPYDIGHGGVWEDAQASAGDFPVSTRQRLLRRARMLELADRLG